MKSNIILATAIFVCIASYAEDYKYLTVKQEDKTISIPLDKIESVTFTVEDLSDAEDFTLRVLTFEDADYKGNGNYLGQRDWSSLIDNPQYGGPLLYGNYEGTPYRWHDQGNTELYSAIDPDDEGNVYWSGGEAISNYRNSGEYIGYTQQLSTPNGGHHNSNNFCVHNGYFDGVFYDTPRGGIWFADGEARVIDHMYVSLTSYALSVGRKGNEMCAAATKDDWVRFVAIGTDASGNTRQTEITMCESGQFTEGWIKWDLSVLGEIVRLDFNIDSSMKAEYGLNFPGYIAYDDIAVRFPKQ